ncbi:hypothetical protein MICAG_1160029 [Microcystis aeruginosa PCC 9808]|uniref:DUF4278 domain-containing protein n=2 Tax=Microcystis aeruginosa TaxID=1126 RepID=I4HFY2_MICAE|nr:hypothetical protein MICAG_1160029 [Microcystis aeruginosa PCC 9808]
MILGYRGVPYLKNLGVVQTIQKQIAFTYRGQAYHITQSLASGSISFMQVSNYTCP